MKKQQIRILAVLAAVALLLGVALFVLRYEKAPLQLPALISANAEDITALTITNRSGTNTFIRDQDGWQKSDDPNFPVSTDTLETMLALLCSLRPQAAVENADREELGFTDPQCILLVAAGEHSKTLMVGSMNAITDQLYVLSGDTVYLTDTSLLQAFSGSALDLARQPAIPKPDNHQQVEVENFQGTLTLSCRGADTGADDGTWCVRQEDGTWVEADPNAAYNFYFLTWDMHFKSTAAYITDSAQLADYGLDDPQVRYTLTYGGETFEVLFGSNLPDDTTYVMCAGSSLVCTMDTLVAKWLAQAKISDVLPTTSS